MPSFADGEQPAGRAPAPPPLNLVQDFVNTEIPEWHVDGLSTPDELQGWLVARGMLDGGDEVDADDFVRARGLRAALRELALANTLGRPTPLETVAALAACPLVAALEQDGSLGIDAAGEGVERALGRIVVIALRSARDGDWRRLKACRKDGCGWVFYDASRNRSSSWCSMTICGNRDKTARYRRRAAGA